MLISVVIRTLNESRYLGELLESLRSQHLDDDQLEIVVIDSGSTDGTLQIARNSACRITHIDRAEFSFGRSLNMGCDFANGDVLVFVSGHCVPCNNLWLKRLVEPLKEGRAAYVYGCQRGRDTTKFSEQKLFEKYFPSDPIHVQPDSFCNNANAAILTEHWQSNRFDEEITGLEDMELAKRLLAQGERIEYVPNASVFHIHDETWGQTKRRYEREAIALQKIMPEVHVGRRDLIRYFVSSVLHDASLAIQERRFRAEFFGIVKFRFAQYYGTYRGNHEHRQLSQRKKDRYFYPKHMVEQGK